MAKKKTPNKSSSEEPDVPQDLPLIAPSLEQKKNRIFGLFFVIISIFLALAIISYFFTWQDDYDKVSRFLNLFSEDPLIITNIMGFLGAYFSNILVVYGFGVSSIIFCWLFFIVGMNLIKPLKKFHPFKVWFNSLYLIVFISLILATAFPNSSFSFGGELGKFMQSALIKLIGLTGTIIFEVFLLCVFVLINYNIHDIRAIFRGQENPENTQIIETQNQPQKAVSTPINQTEIKPQPVENIPQNIPQNIVPDIVIVKPEDNQQINFEVIEKETESTKKNKKDVSELTLDIQPTATDLEDQVPINEIKSTVEIKNKSPQSERYYDIPIEINHYEFPSLELLDQHGLDKTNSHPLELENYKNQIVTTLKNYDILIQSISATIGPTVTLFEIIPAPGIRISKIKNLEDDIALSLSALGIRIIAPIPGKGTIGIEVPNAKKAIVGIRTLLSSEKFTLSNFTLPIALGKKINNENFILDLATMPHLLMAGATGQGKSVGINALLVSLLYKKNPAELKFVLVDPKKVELSLYQSIEKHYLAKLPGEEDPIITDTKKVINTLNALCIEMDNRYDLLKAAGCRNIKEYNIKYLDHKLNPLDGHQFLPYIVLIIDEFADLIMTAGKEVELPIARLAQLARAIGIHLIIATQRPSVNIITGTIKANFPARIAFKVSSKIDSRTILDMGGAEQLIGRGDMLVNYNGDLTRVQCALVDTPEIEKICNHIEHQTGFDQTFYLPEYIDEKDAENASVDITSIDPMFFDAARLIFQTQLGSTSLIQRKMKLGYNRAGRIMDQLEAAGIVGGAQGSKPREVKVRSDIELQEIFKNYT